MVKTCAAEQGFAQAKINLYNLAKKNVPEALKFLINDAEIGIPEAQNKLGEIYSKGIGLPQNYLDAHMWLNLAGTQGNKNVIRNRNYVERKMSPEQIGRAQKMVRRWKPKNGKN